MEIIKVMVGVPKLFVVYLSLGSNLGDRLGFIAKAVDALKDHDILFLKSSRVIETDPVGGPVQGKYLNCVIKVQTILSLEDLFVLTSRIEHQLGRMRNIKNGPRVIDIDILLFDDVKFVSKSLIVPHPRMFERDFVMRPLKEIEPQLCALYKI